MCNSQHWKIKLVYIGFGSLFGCLCTIIGMLASPATAQKNLNPKHVKSPFQKQWLVTSGQWLVKTFNHPLNTLFVFT